MPPQNHDPGKSVVTKPAFKGFENFQKCHPNDRCGCARDDESSFARDDKGFAGDEKIFARNAKFFSSRATKFFARDASDKPRYRQPIPGSQ